MFSDLLRNRELVGACLADPLVEACAFVGNDEHVRTPGAEQHPDQAALLVSPTHEGRTRWRYSNVRRTAHAGPTPGRRERLATFSPQPTAHAYDCPSPLSFSSLPPFPHDDDDDDDDDTTRMFASVRILPRSLRLATVASLSAGGAYYLLVPPTTPDPRDVTRRYKVPPAWTPPPREELLQNLRQSGNGDPQQQEFDLLVIGGGATGAGVALDAVTRGLKVALVERNDFSSGAPSHCVTCALSLICPRHLHPGTSSKSTKLVHGGVRYLQKAIMNLDHEQYKLVREALHERKVFLHTAPYLSVMQPIMLPVYKWVHHPPFP